MKTKLLLALAATVVVAGAFLPRPFSAHPFFRELSSQLDQYWSVTQPEKVYLHFDRTFYRPGEDIWFKAYLRDALTHQGSPQSDILYVELLSPKGSVIEKRHLLAIDGSAPGDFTLDKYAPGGIYKIRAYTNWMRNTGDAFEREITVQASVLPRLRMNMQFERKAFGPGDEVIARLDLHTLDNHPLGNHDFSFNLKIDGQTIATRTTRTSPAGRAYLSVPLPDDLTSMDGLLAVQIPYRGRTESISRAVPIVLNRIDLRFLPEGGDAIAGLPGVIAFKAVNEFGKAADVAGVILDEEGKEVAHFTSFHMGMGSFTLTPRPSTRYTACLTRPAGNEQVFELPPALDRGYQLSVTGQDRDFVYLAAATAGLADTLFITGLAGGEVRYQKVVSPANGSASLEVPVVDWPIGVAVFTLFDGQGVARSERLVFVNSHQQLRVDIQTDKEKYLPREKVDMTIKVTDERGHPVEGDFSLAVTDDNLLSFADDKQGRLLAQMLLQSELKGEIEEPNFYFDPDEPKAPQALDYLMLTHGWRRLEWQRISSPEPYVAVTYPPERARIAGKVISPDKHPVADAEITLLPDGITVKTDENGSFSFRNIRLDYRSELAMESKKYQGSFPVYQYSEDKIYPLQRKPYVYANSPGKGGVILSGQVADYDNGEPILYGSVEVLRDGKRVAQTPTDLDGMFSVNLGAQGRYDIVTSYVGYEKVTVHDVNLKAGKHHKLDIFMKPGVVLEEVVVKDFQVPLIQQDNSTVGQALPRDVVKERAGWLKRNHADLPEEALPLDEDLDIKPPRLAEPPPPPVVEEEVVFADQSIEAKAEVGIPVAGGQDGVPPAPPPPPPPPPMPELKEVFKVVEQMPRFPGCEDLANERDKKTCANEQLMAFIYQNIRYPATALEHAIEGTVVIQFVVNQEGSVENAHIVRDIGGQCGQEALKVVQAMNTQNIKWTPGTQRGRPVKTMFNLPVRFRLRGSNQQDAYANEKSFAVTPSSIYYRARSFYAPEYALQPTPEKDYDDRTTIYWDPAVKTNKWGVAKVSFYTSDAVTTFRASLEGFGASGQPAQADYRFYTQPLFEVDARLPALALTGDTLVLPLRLVNNSRRERCGQLTIHWPEELASDEPATTEICLPAGSYQNLSPQLVAVTPLEEGTIAVSFSGDGLEGEWQSDLRVLPRGFPVEGVVSGMEKNNRFSISLNDPVPGSLQATLTVYPNQLNELLTGMERMLRQPAGCFEQVSSSNYPNLLVLDLLRQSGQANPEIEAQAAAMLENGYRKLTGYESPGGGFHWWGNDPGHEALTAYGLMQFVDMKRVFPVDEEMIRRASAWLLSRRDGRGGWQSSGPGLHSWQDGPGVRNAFIVYALSEAGMGQKVRPELDHAYREALENEDAYSLALLANAFLANQDRRAQKILEDLLPTQHTDGYWEGASASVVCSRGAPLRVETTALTALALMRSGYRGEALQKAMKFLTSSRTPYGFGNTQSTVLALKALAFYARRQARPSSDGEVVVMIDGKEVARRAYRTDTPGKIIIEGLGAYLQNGEQQVEVHFAKTPDPLPFDLMYTYTMRTPPSSPECPLELKTELMTAQTTAGATVRLSSTVTNTSAEPAPTPMALIGIPAGLSPQPWQLKELVEKGIVDYYEQAEGFVYFYFEQLEGHASRAIHLDLKADIPGYYEAPASSAYLYYGNEHRSWSAPGRISVGE